MSKEVRKKSNSKLSLRKKGRGDNAKVVLIPDVDQDETSEFQHSRHAKATSTCRSIGTEVIQSRDKQIQRRETTRNLSYPEENVRPDVKRGADPIDVNREEESTSVDDSADSRCLACGLFFTQVDLKGHIQRCLQLRFKRTIQPVTGSADERTDEEDSYSCPCCKRDLSCLNSKLKTQHLNRCIDKVEKEKNDEEKKQETLERAKKAVLPCPICGKPSKTENARKGHLKKCATTNEVRTDQVLKLVKDQEEKHRQQLAAGIIPQDIGNMKNTAEMSTARARNKMFKEPKSQFDEDTQLAMAISSSLDEKDTNLIGPTLGSAAARNLQVQDQHKRKKRKKGEPEGIPLLLALSDEEKTRRQQLRVCNLLVPQDGARESEITPTMANSELQKQTQSTHLWMSSSLKETGSYNFYVLSLMPPIEKSKAVMGTKIRSLLEIPGRRSSLLLSNQDELIYKTNDGDMTVQKDELMATTQTAVVLAELAREMDDDILDTTVQSSGFCPERTIKVKRTTQTEAVSSLQTDMLGLVNNPTGSDVTVLVSNNEEICAHTVILSCRCPILLQLEKDSEISLLNVPSEVMLAVLKFVYAGQISLYNSNVSQVLSLSKRLHLDELTNICEEALAQTSNEMKKSPDDQNSDLDAINNHQSGVDKLLKDVWGEDDDNTEVGPQETSSEGSPYKSDGGCDDVRSPQMLHIINKHSDGAEDGEKHTLHIKDLRIQSRPVCGDEGDNLDMKENKLQQEINNFFQDESFDMTCEVQTERSFDTACDGQKEGSFHTACDGQKEGSFHTACDGQKEGSFHTACDGQKEGSFDIVRDNKTKFAKNKSRSLIFENDELAVFSDSSSQSPVDENDESLGQSYNTGKMIETDNKFTGEITTRKMIETDNKFTGEITTRKMIENNNKFTGEITTEVKEDTLIICSDESDNEINDDQNLKLGYDDRNDTGHYSPQLVQDKSRLLISRNNTRLFDNNSDVSWKEELERSESSPAKTFQHSDDSSPASSRLSPDLIEEEEASCSFLSLSSPSRKRTRSARTSKTKSPVVVFKSSPTANTSGLDLFGSPSPCNKKRKTDSPERIEASTHSYQQNSATRTLFIHDKHLNPSDSQQPGDPYKPTAICDVECIGGNLHQTSQGSPIFQGKTKKKCFIQVTTSPPKIQNLSPKGKLRRNTDLSQGERTSTDSSENKAMWIEASPVKNSQENNHDIKGISSNIDLDVSIPRDVWDDFDDSGAGFGGTSYIPPVTPSGHNSSFDQDESNPKTNSRIHGSPADQTPKLQRHLEKAPKHLKDASQRTDSDNIVMWGEDHASNVLVNKEADGQATMSFKTPTVSSRQKAAVHWVPPSPFTPMPQYDSMNTPQLKREVQRIGVRPVGKKRMVALLKDVYNKTHQYETDSNVEDEEDEEDEEDKEDEQSSCMKEQEADELNSSQESSQSDMMEESYLQGSTDDLVLSQASQQDDSALSEKLYQFVKSSTDIYRKVLMYEPLEVDWLKKEITEAGIKCSMEKLLCFLDEKCITFTMKKMRKERNLRRGKGRGKPSPKKGTDSSPKKGVSSKRTRGSPQKCRHKAPTSSTD
ncbi:uncharacterized protein LOC117329918 [Pecten maximus]|uniref:uncharacterized protein LOC117329918 n=1 Tax=Pecten maximus TaxID=6579 RepID=UPI0014588F24|nr:uncharacterized protein LOC117329918 [Pecten maximus]